MDWNLIITNFLSPETLTVIVGAIIAFIVRKGWVKKDKAEKIERLVDAGVIKTYHEYVKGIKDGNSDGKLTDAEKAEARARAIAYIKDNGFKLGVDAVKDFGLEYITALIEKKVQSNKK